MKKLLLSAFLVMSSVFTFAQEASGPLISEVCGSGTSVNGYRDFVELYNPTQNDISLSGWSIKYKSATSTNANSSFTIPVGTVIKSYGYLLIGFVGSNSFVVDLDGGNIDFSGSMTGGGHVALCSPSTTGPDKWGKQQVEDLIGWGTGNSPEGSAAPFHPAFGGSLKRKASASSTSATIAAGGAEAAKGNGYDTNDNSVDFVVKSIAGPSNSSSPLKAPDYKILFNNNYPSLASISIQSFDLKINANRDGKYYYVVVQDGEQTPSNAQIKSGSRFNNSPAAVSGNAVISLANTDYLSTVSGLQPNTSYDIYVIAENYYGTTQASATKLDVSTVGTLPVTLTNFTASYSAGILTVKWKTASEKNNSFFVVQGSTDGKKWTDLRKTNAVVNAFQGAEYAEDINFGKITFAGLGLFGLLLIPIYNRRCRVIGLLFFCSLLFFSCSKESAEVAFNLESTKLNSAKDIIYLRLAQVDRDGTITYSEAISVRIQ
jgi:hypothetical protein